MRFWRRKRRERASRTSRRGVAVIGQELAAATEREEQHRAQLGDVNSPLGAIAYDVRSGELDLHRFIESPVDSAVGKFIADYQRLDPGRAKAIGAALTMDDFYTLLAFARRSALASLQGREEPSLDQGLLALTAVDIDRIDWRDLGVAAELVAWAMARARLDHATEFRAAAKRSERGVADVLNRTADRRTEELEPGMWRCVETASGPVLANTYFHHFEPTIDLVTAAMAIQDVFEADVYRVRDLTVEADVPPVWLTPADQRALDGALERVRACVSLHAEASPAATPTASNQTLYAFLAETVSADDAGLIAAAAVPARSYQAVGIGEGALGCVVVARSIMEGIPAFERAGTLERFREPLSDVLKQAVRRG